MELHQRSKSDDSRVYEVIPEVLVLRWSRTFAKSRAANGKMRSLPTEALNTNTKCLTDLGRAGMCQDVNV